MLWLSMWLVILDSEAFLGGIAAGNRRASLEYISTGRSAARQPVEAPTLQKNSYQWALEPSLEGVMRLVHI